MVIIITIYNSKETTFTHNGLGILLPKSCEVTEVKKGLFELELEHTLDSSGKWQNIIEDNIIKAPTPRGNQLFRIYRKVPSMVGIKAYARHIFYDLLDNFLEDVRPTNLTGAGALDWVLTHTQFPHAFTSMSDVSTVNSASYVRKNPVQALISDEENSFLNRWGGELIRDNFTVKILQTAGTDRGVTVRYKKNITGFECDTNLDGVITRVMPTGLQANDTILILPEKYIDSPYINNYSKPKIKEFHFQDIKVSDTLTLTQAYELLRQRANELFAISKIDIPTSNTKVNFIELSKTEEYKNFSVLETVYLYDTVTIKYEPLNIDLKAQVIKYKYDAILRRYIELELGDYRSNLASSLIKLNKGVNDAAAKIDYTKTELQKAIDNATTLLTSALGGHVLKRESEILIMDTVDPNTAVKIWRWNLNGLGYSSTGINGPYSLAMTMDGAIVADFITTGVLSAALIKTGIIVSTDGSISINISNGAFHIGGRENDTAEHSPSFSKWKHSDGSYSQASTDGFKKYIAGTEKSYHYLTYTGSVITIGNTADAVRVQLPDEFKGKDFDAVTFLRDTNNDSSAVWERLLKITCFISAIDRINATIDIIGYAYYSDDWSNLFNKPIQVGFMITA